MCRKKIEEMYHIHSESVFLSLLHFSITVHNVSVCWLRNIELEYSWCQVRVVGARSHAIVPCLFYCLLPPHTWKGGRKEKRQAVQQTCNCDRCIIMIIQLQLGKCVFHAQRANFRNFFVTRKSEVCKVGSTLYVTCNGLYMNLTHIGIFIQQSYRV